MILGRTTQGVGHARPTGRPRQVAIRLVTLGMLAVAVLAAGASLTACSKASGSQQMAEPSTTLAPEDILRRVRSGVVRVRNTACGALGTGTAWLADDGRMISNRHVVEDAHLIELLTWDGIDLAASGASVSDSVDVAVIDGEWDTAMALEPLATTSDRVDEGDRLTIVGYPNGERLEARSGVAVGYSLDPDLAPIELLRATTVVEPGNSGGPVLDSSGRVVGVVFAEYIATDEALIIPWDVVAALGTQLAPAPACR